MNKLFSRCILLMLITVSTCYSSNRNTFATSLAHSAFKRHPNHNTERQTPQNKTQKKPRCKSCEGKKKPLSFDLEERFRKTVPNWEIHRSETHKITRIYTFKDFKTAMQFINKVAELAEYEGHHPDIQVHSFNQVRIELYTHALSGLSKNDFYLAESIDDIWYNEFAHDRHIIQ